ncbi:MAG: TatD family hydrolase [Candidatus Heimdallarchaeaceae archaeon]
MVSSRISVQEKKKVKDKIYSDAHAHLVPQWFNFTDVQNIVEKARESNVQVIVNSALDPKNYEFGLKTTEFKEIFLSVGYLITNDNKEKVKQLIEFYLENQSSIHAIGEVGLDHYWVKEIEKQKQQEKNFREIISFSLENDIPLVIHSRNAEEKAINILKEMGAENVLMHCFSGSKDQAREISRLSWFISLPTSTVYRKNFQRILQATALDSLMFETDSPYHSLEKGERNDPTSIPTLCRHAAHILELEENVLASITTKNVKHFYRI